MGKLTINGDFQLQTVSHYQRVDWPPIAIHKWLCHYPNTDIFVHRSPKYPVEMRVKSPACFSMCGWNSMVFFMHHVCWLFHPSFHGKNQNVWELNHIKSQFCKWNPHFFTSEILIQKSVPSLAAQAQVEPPHLQSSPRWLKLLRYPPTRDPPNGWFISWKIHQEMMISGYPPFRKPLMDDSWNGGIYLKIIHFNRVFHEINQPFGATPIFGTPHMSRSKYWKKNDSILPSKGFSWTNRKKWFVLPDVHNISQLYRTTNGRSVKHNIYIYIIYIYIMFARQK
jgi:hypothetical protein